MTVPAITFAKLAGSSTSQRYAVVTITNASTLAAEGSNVRVELGNGVSPTSFSALTVITAAMLAAGSTAFRVGPMSAGSAHAARARAEQPGARPSAYCSPVAMTLDGLTAPSGLSITDVAGDSTQVDVKWTNGEANVPIVVLFKKTGAATWRTVVAKAGSTVLRIGTLKTATGYSFDVSHQESAPYTGGSSSATGTHTTGSSTVTLTMPENPSSFAGSIDESTGAFVNDGTYGLEVTALDFPSTIVYEVAVETAVGAGTFGSYEEPPRGRRSAVQRPARTRFVQLAESDGLKRRMHAYATRDGATDSGYTPAVDVLPYAPQRPVEYPVVTPTITLGYDTVLQAGIPRGVVTIDYTQPTSPQFGHMEYSVRYRDPVGPGAWSTPSIVIGARHGPDVVSVQAGLEYGITPITVTLNDGVRSTDGVEKYYTVAASSTAKQPVTVDDETATIPLSRQLAAKTGDTTVDIATAGKIKVALEAIGAAAGPIGDATHVAAVTIDAKGRVTVLSAVAITGTPPGGAAGGDLTGTYPNPTLAAIVSAAGPIGDATHVAQLTIDAKGRVTVVTSVPITFPTALPPNGAAGGDLSGTYPNPSLAAAGPGATGPIGDATHVPAVTIDAKGRVTALSSIAIAVAPSGAAGGDLSGTYPNPTLSGSASALSPAFAALTDGATITWATAGARVVNAKVTLGGNRTLSITGAVDGQVGTLKLTQDGTGSRTLTLPAGSKVSGTGAGAITLSTAAGATDFISYMYDGTNYWWTYGKTYT